MEHCDTALEPTLGVNGASTSRNHVRWKVDVPELVQLVACFRFSCHSFWKHSWNFLARNVLFNACVSAVQVVMQLVRLLPDGHRMKREVDMALDCVSETMTPMHYHLREIIISKYRQVQHISTPKDVSCHLNKCADKWHNQSAAVSHEPYRWHQLLFQMPLSCSLDPSENHCSGNRRCSLWKMIVVQDNLSHKAWEFQAWPCFVSGPHDIKFHRIYQLLCLLH